MFAVVFGLSMDYEVFLVSRVREEWVRRRDASAAVADGIAFTGRVISAAAAIMICVFLSFMLGNERVAQGVRLRARGGGLPRRDRRALRAAPGRARAARADARGGCRAGSTHACPHINIEGSEAREVVAKRPPEAEEPAEREPAPV